MADTKISALTAATTLADTDELVLASAGASKKITGANLKASIPGTGGGVTELSYVEFSSAVSITATAEGSANTVVTAAALTVSGSTRICVEFYCANVQLPPSATGQVIICLYEGGSSIGRLAQLLNVAAATGGPSVFARRYWTPSAGTYTWSVRAWEFGGTATIAAGAGGSGNQFPGYIRITKGG